MGASLAKRWTCRHHRFVRTLMSSLWIMLCVPAFAAAEPKAVGLDDVLRIAVRQAPSLTYAALDRTVADGQLQSQESDFDLQLGAQAGVVANGGSADSKTAFSEVGVGKLLQTGTRLWASLGYDWNKADATALAPSSTTHGMSVGAELTQPLLRGRGGAAAAGALRVSRLQRSAATLAAEAAARSTVRDIVVAYWQVAIARRSLDVQRGSLELFLQQLKITDAMINNQMLAKSDRWAVEQVIATQRQSILSAEESLWSASLNLRRLAGMEIGGNNIEVVTKDLPKMDDLADVDVAAKVDQALAANADLAALEKRAAAATASAEAARGNGSRSLDLALGYDRTGRDIDAGGAASALSNDADWTARATLVYGGGTGGRADSLRNLDGEAQRKIAEAERRRAKALLLEQRAAIAAQAAQAAQRLRSAKERVTLGTNSVKLAEQIVKAEQKRFELGKSTSIFEVLRRQDELAGAQLRQVSALADYLTAAAELDALAGDILTKHSITIPSLP